MVKYVVRWRKGKGSWNKKNANYKSGLRLANKKFAQGYEIQFDKIGGVDDRIPANAVELVPDSSIVPL